MYPFYTSSQIQDKWLDIVDYKEEALILGTGGMASIHISNNFSTSADVFVIRGVVEKLNNKFLYYYLKNNLDVLKAGFRGAGLKHLSKEYLKEIQIPLPPFEIQKQIVTELESYQKIIDGAKQVVDNYKPTIKIDPSWKMVELGDIFEKVNKIIDPLKNKGVGNYIGLENIVSNNGELIGEIETEISKLKSAKSVFQKEDILYGKLRPNLNKVWFSDREGVCSTDILVLRAKNKEIDQNFYSILFRGENFNGKVLTGLKGAQLPRVSFDFISAIEIPFPPLIIQKEIVTKVDNEQQCVYSAKRTINLFEQKIKDKISGIWGE
jgi:restriction endonuclease S subunit